MRARYIPLRLFVLLLLQGWLLTFPAAAQTPDAEERMAEVRRLFRLAGSFLPQIEDAQECGLLASNLAARQVDAGDLEGALETARSLPTDREKASALGIIALVQLDKSDLSAAQRTLDEIHSPEMKEFAVQNIVAHLLRKSDVTTAIQMAETIPASGFRRVVSLVLIAEWQAKNKQPGDAAQTLREARTLVLARVSTDTSDKTLRETASLLSLVGAAQWRVGDQTESRATMDYLKSLLEKTENPMTRDAVLMSLADAQTKTGELALALDTIKMIREGSRHSALHRFVSERAFAKDFSSAMALARDIENQSLRDSAYQLIAWSQAAAGDEAGSRETLKLIVDDHVRAGTLERIGSAQVRRRPAEAAATLDQAEQEARELTRPREQAELFERLAGDQVRMQDLDRALELALQNPLPAHRGRALERVLGQMVLRGESGRAYEIAEEQTVPIVRSYAWFGIAQGLMSRIGRDRKVKEQKQ